LGVARLEAGDFAGARDAFFDATALAPGDRDARFNLEWALRALAAEPPPAPMQSDEPSDEPPLDDTGGESEPEESPPEEPEASERSESAETLPRSPAALSPEEISRWLEAVEDRPQAAFRAALEEDGTKRSGPQW
ncbi:MAG: hypothetical protein ABFS41_02230, partial [Myxococcota bacterium]